MARYVWRVRRSVPHLNIETGDYLFFDPGAPRIWSIHRPLSPLDYGAVMGAEEAGHLELVRFTPDGRVPLRLVRESESQSPETRPATVLVPPKAVG